VPQRLPELTASACPQVTREHYLRRDIYCGSPLAAPENRGELSPSAATPWTLSTHSKSTQLTPGPDLEACKLSGTADAYLVVDTNVALHQVKTMGRCGESLP
jgi:hypothetical protein